MSTRTKTSLKTIPTAYHDLVAFFPPRTIRDEVGYENTVEIIDAMAGHKLTDDQDDYLDLLSRLVEDYEAETSPEPKAVSGLESLRFLLKENDLSGDDLAEILGVDRSTAYKILKGNRGLTPNHIRRLANRFKVSADLFLKE
jgi:HTH-type transcriptional regulator/antitoxin HigA